LRHITTPAARTKESVMLFHWTLITPLNRRSKPRFYARGPWGGLLNHYSIEKAA